MQGIVTKTSHDDIYTEVDTVNMHRAAIVEFSSQPTTHSHNAVGFCSLLIQACTNLWCTEVLKEEADDCRMNQIKKKDFANMLWLRLIAFIKEHPETQTVAVPENVSHKSMAGKKASAQNWPMDELEMLVKSKFPGAEPYEIQAEKFVDEVMVGLFMEKIYEPRAADDFLSQDRWNSTEAQVLLAYVRYN